MKRMQGIVLLAAALIVGGLSIPAANAVATGTAVIVTPAQGKIYETSFDGPIVVDLSQAGAVSDTDTFEVSYANLVRPGEWQWHSLGTLSGSAARNEVAVPSLGTGDWAVRVDPTWLGDEYTVQNNFAVNPVGPKVSDLSANPDPFYPLVRDGYRDKATVGFRLSKDAQVTLRVYGESRAVRSQHWSNLGSGRTTWSWDGRRSNGEVVKPGIYMVEVTATDAAYGTFNTATRKVEVATDMVTRREVIERRGPATTDRARAGNCQFRSLSRELMLDCWAGQYAKATYVYRIPRGAFDVHHRIYGERGCCDPGRIEFSGERISRTRYRTTVKVTNWRSYSIEWADLHYKYKVRR